MSATEIENTTSATTTAAPAAAAPAPEAVTVREAKFEISPEDTIFVSNIARECTEDDLKNVFQGEFGSVEVDIPTSKTRTGQIVQSRYAFVKFPQTINPEDIVQKYEDTKVKDRTIYLKKAMTPEEREAQRQAKFNSRRGGRGAFRGRGGRRGNMGGGLRGAAVPAPPKKEKVPLEEMERSKDTLYVNNVPYSATKAELAEFFGTTEESIVLPMRRMKDMRTNRVFFSKRMNRGIAFVSFPELSVDISKKVEEFQGKTLQDREISVDVAALKPQTEEEQQATAPAEDVEETNA